MRKKEIKIIQDLYREYAKEYSKGTKYDKISFQGSITALDELCRRLGIYHKLQEVINEEVKT